MAHPTMLEALGRSRPGGIQKAGRYALVLGFSAMLSLLLLAGLYSLSVLSRVEALTAQSDQRFLETDRTLDRLRISFFSTGTALRDYLLDPDPVSSEASLAELKKLRAGLTGILENYGSLVPAEDRPAFEELGHNLQEYWQLIDPVLPEWPQLEQAVLHFVR